MVKEWMKWCRLCAQEDSSNTHVNVFFEDEKGLPLSDTIQKCFSIDINHVNNWPNTICVHCFSLVESIIHFSQKTSRVNAMFSELLDAIDDIDPNKVRVRYELHTISDTKFDLTRPIANTTVNDFKFTEIPTEMNEPMIDVGELKYVDSDLLNTAIKTEEKDEDYEEKSDQIPTSPEGSNYEDGSSESHSDPSKNKKEKNKKNRKRKHKLRKAKKADNKPKKPEQYRCSDCDMGFIKHENYRRHMQRTHDIAIEKKPRLLICETCGKEYKSVPGLNEHKLTHLAVRKYKCKYCEKRFNGLSSIKRHEDTHNETKYICVVCGLQLNTQRTLGQHMIVHSDQKNHKCDLCGKDYKRAKALKYHLITHAGLRPYFCDFCEKTFTNAANCRIHKKRHHPVEFAEQEATGKKKTSAIIPNVKDLKALLDNRTYSIPETMDPIADVGSTSAMRLDQVIS